MSYQIALTVNGTESVQDVGTWRDHAAELYGAARRRLVGMKAASPWALELRDTVSGEALYTASGGVS